MTVKNLTHTNNQNLKWVIDSKWYPIVIPDDIGNKIVDSWKIDNDMKVIYIRTTTCPWHT